MENPFTAFARLKEIAGRRPRVVTAVGLALLAECGRVVWGLRTAETVTLYGHAGGEALSVATDAVWIIAYAIWVAFCGLAVVSFALRVIWRGFGARTIAAETASTARQPAPPTVVRRR